jgi:uncharacterized cupin superfamily protein
MSVPVKQERKIYAGSRNTNPKEWVPLEFDHPRGKQLAGEMAFFRAEGSATHTLLMGLWRTSPLAPGCDPKTGECTFAWHAPWGDEQVHVIEGSVTVTNNDTGEVHKFQAGDIFSMSKGTDTDWHVDGPFFKKYFCIAHSEPSGLQTAEIPLADA